MKKDNINLYEKTSSHIKYAKGSDHMKNIITIENLSEEQQSLMATLTMAWPQLTEMQKGKLLGYVEAKAEDRREERNRATA